MNKERSDIILSLLLIAVSAYILLSDGFVQGGLETDLGSVFLPRTVAVIMVLLSLSIIGTAVRAGRANIQKKELQTKPQLGYSGAILYMLAIVGYWLILPYLGFLISSVLAMLFVAYIFNCKGIVNWLKVLVMALVICIGLDYGTKAYLRVYLPTFSLF